MIYPTGYLTYLVHALVLIPAEVGHNVLKRWPLLRLLMPASLHQRGVALRHVLGYGGAVACDDLKEHLHGEGLLTDLMKVTRQLRKWWPNNREHISKPLHATAPAEAELIAKQAAEASVAGTESMSVSTD